MPRQHLVRMRNRHAREACVIETQRRPASHILLAEQPLTIERINSSSLLCLSFGLQGKQRNPNQPHTAALDETSSVDSSLHLFSCARFCVSPGHSQYRPRKRMGPRPLDPSVSTTYPSATADGTDCVQIRSS